ncbi:MAG: M23 family metallopeptidase [Elusimicrobia bacterium]|nr:M23 family metallopeptidase [Elusimicrobiota bacterium]
MKKRYNIVSVLLVLIFILYGRISAYSIKISSFVFVQGDTIKAEITDYNKDYFYDLYFNDEKYAFVGISSGGAVILPEQVCYIGVPYDIKAGSYTINISEYRTDNENNTIRKIEIKIKKAKFPVQYLKFSPEKYSKIDAPENERERELIKKAVQENTPQKMWDGKFKLPVNGKIKGFFGVERRTKKRFLWQHKGIDISAAKGTPISAPANGKVILASEDFNINGKTVILDHGLGVTSVYIHLDKITVKNEDNIKKGEIIGNVGDSGLSTAPNLHWGIYVHSIPVNPLWWLKNE